MASMRIGLLAYLGCFASEIFGISDVLAIGSRVARTVRPDEATPVAEVVSARPSLRVPAAGGVLLAGRPASDCDVVVVPGFEASTHDGPVDDLLTGLGPELAFLRRAHDDGAQVVSVCVGAFLLGAAGLLEGRRATTSWLFADTLARRHPGCSVEPSELVVRDGGVTTTAAFSAMYDFTLQLIASLYGDEVARATARIALLDESRTSQSPYVVEDLLPPSGSSFGAEVQRHLKATLAEPFELSAVAAAFNVSPRTLSRRFRADTGLTPLAFVQAQRVRRAQHLLATTTRPVGEVAAQVGYTDPSTFSELFRRVVGMAPRDYRTQFSGVSIS